LKQQDITSLCEYNGILIACSADGLIRSTDNGAHWETVIADKGVFFSTKIVDGHFVAIRSYDPSREKSSFFKPKCSFISPDAGKNWQCIDATYTTIEGLYDFKKIDNALYCGNKTGIFRSKDDGRTWELILPLKDAKEFERLEVISSEKTIFIAKVWAGC
ncbi:MAG: WD40/YVTN/BNR-like repeat-containing protein, partial [Cytophagales bacterium]